MVVRERADFSFGSFRQGKSLKFSTIRLPLVVWDWPVPEMISAQS